MTDYWAACDGDGQTWLHRIKPRWNNMTRLFVGSVQMMWPNSGLKPGEMAMARLVIDPSTVTSACATSASTDAESMPERCESVVTTR